MPEEEKKAENEKPREFSKNERVKVKKAPEDLDIMEDFLEDKEHKEEEFEDVEEKEAEQEAAEPIDKESGTVEEGAKEEESAEQAEEKAGEEKPKKKAVASKKPKVQKKKAAELEIEEIAEEPEDKMSEEVERPSKEEIKRRLHEKMQMAVDAEDEHEIVRPQAAVALKFLEDEKAGNVFIGRKKLLFKKYGYEAALQVGKVEEDEHRDKKVFLDSLNPHVVFICGSRGSGKSYDLGVIAEEVTLKNKNVGAIVIDPIGVFWSMKYPNKEERELAALNEWGLETQGLKSLKVFIPAGMKSETPKETYDATFSMQPSLLTADDWCLTFGIERFSPTGLLLDKVLKSVEDGYKNSSGTSTKGKSKRYSLDDMISCLEYNAELASREKGFKHDSIRALISRFEAAKHWGIFDERGTPLSELSRENQLTIIDTSFLDDSVTALVIGILARRILAARKISMRKEAATKFKEAKVEDLLELDIPPTWLFIDEAHTLIPSGNARTPATNSLVEYVKQGRRPGCSLVLATQQPSAIDTKVLSQLDVLVAHKLIFDDDIKAVFKRAPTIIPMKYKRPAFLKTMPIGMAMVADREEETSRAFVMRIRPRMSQHEGREAETIERGMALNPKHAEKLAIDMVTRNLEEAGMLEIATIEQAIESLNRKYKCNVETAKVLEALQKLGYFMGADTISVERPKAETEVPTEAEAPEISKAEEKFVEQTARPTAETVYEQTELLALPLRVTEDKALRTAEAQRKKRMLGLFGKEEILKNISLKYITIWKVRYDVFNRSNEFVSRECYINSLTGEFMHFKNGQFVESKGVRELYDLPADEIRVLRLMTEREMTPLDVAAKTGFDEQKTKRILDKLHFMRFLSKTSDKSGKHIYWLAQKLDLPPNEMTDMLQSLTKLPFVKAQVLSKERELFRREHVQQLLPKIWKNILVRKTEEIFWPIWKVELQSDGKTRFVGIDGVTGQVV